LPWRLAKRASASVAVSASPGRAEEVAISVASSIVPRFSIRLPVEGEAPVILLAHEPDIFPEVPDRISLTLSGHTHAGQVNLFGWTPVVPSHFGCRYVYGHIVEQGRHLIVSSGLGYSKLPIRFNTVPEIVLLDIGEQERVAQIRQIGDRKR
jgi:predicted MPP superfamily phosphohydrolase